MKATTPLALFRSIAWLVPAVLAIPIIPVAASAQTAAVPPVAGTCKVFSLDHVQTFDAMDYDVNAPGPFMVVESNALSVQLGMSLFNATLNTWTTVAVRFGPTVWTYGSQGLTGPTGSANGVTVTQTVPGQITFQMIDGSKVQITQEVKTASGIYNYAVNVSLPASAKGNVKGLCGNFNGNQSDDNLSPSGQPTPFGPALVAYQNGTNLAKAWAPAANQNLFSCGSSCAVYQAANYRAIPTPAPVVASKPAAPSPAPAPPAAKPVPAKSTTNATAQQAVKECNDYLTRNDVPTPSGSTRVLAPMRDVVRERACKGVTDLEDVATRILCLGDAFEKGMIPMNAVSVCIGPEAPKLIGGAKATWPPKEPAVWGTLVAKKSGPAPAPSPVTPPAPAPAPVAASCGTPAMQQSCESLLQNQVPWTTQNTQSPASKHWAQANLDALCKCTTNPPQTVLCFQNALYNNGHTSTWQAAIAACKAK